MWGLLLQLSFASHLYGIYFSILSLSVYMCVEVWSWFLAHIIYMGLVFFIHSASLCLLVGAFNPFTFKVIIDIYVPIQRRKWQPTPVLLPGKYHGWRSLVGYSPWGLKESDRTERLHFLSFSSSFWRRKWQPTPVFLPGESHGWRGLVGCSLWGCKELEMT